MLFVQSIPFFKGQLGIPLTVYPWYLSCSLGILGDYRAYIGIPLSNDPMILKTSTLERRSSKRHRERWFGWSPGTDGVDGVGTGWAPTGMSCWYQRTFQVPKMEVRTTYMFAVWIRLM